MTETMKLWNSVCKTDPTHTTKVNQRGGFTAIAAQYQLQRATELWGSYGNKWGVKSCRYSYIDANDDLPLEATLDAVFFYPEGEFEISTDMTYKVGNDSRKKLLTDLTTKALSKLGFNADVFMGKYDDNKYVNKLKAEFNDKEGAYEDWTNQSKDKLANMSSFKDIEEWWKGNTKHIDKLFKVSEAHFHELTTCKLELKKHFEQQENIDAV